MQAQDASTSDVKLSAEKTNSPNANNDEKENSDTALNTNTYQMRPELQDAFKASQIRDIIQSVLTETLTDKTYSQENAKEWTKHIADEVSTRVKVLRMRRYKHIVQVVLGQQLGAGCKYLARCRWDAQTDNQTSDVFTNATIFCIVTVFGVFLY